MKLSKKRGGGTSGGTTNPSGISGYNTFTYYEEFDQTSTTQHVASPQSSFVTQSIAGGLVLTAPVYQSQPAGTQGCLVVNSAAPSVSGGNVRLNMIPASPWRLAAMLANGLKAEFRFVLEDEAPTRIVNLGWIGPSVQPDTNGHRSAAGCLIRNRNISLIRRDPNGTFLTDTAMATLDLNVPYTVSVDTTSGQLVCKITNGTTNAIVADLTVAKWTGWSGIAEADMARELFSTAGATNNRTSFGFSASIHTAGAVAKILTMDAIYIHCPKLR